MSDETFPLPLETEPASLMEAIRDAYFVLDEAWRFRYLNANALREMGRPRRELIGRRYWDVYPEHEYSEQGDFFRRVRSSDAAESMEAPGADGRRWYSMTAIPFHNGLVVSYRDVTEERRLAQMVRESEARFRATLEGSMDAFFLLAAERDGQGRIVDFRFLETNAMAERLLNEPRGRFLDRKIFDMFPLARPYLFDDYVQVTENGAPLESEFRMELPGVAGRWFRHQVVKVGDGLAITTRDVTERKAQEEALHATNQELAAARDAALEAKRAAERFLALTSHEVRTPLAGVIGMTSLLSGRALDDESLQMIATVRSSGEALLRIVDDLLDLSKVEAGRMELDPAPTDLGRLVREAAALYEGKASEKGIGLEVEVPNDPVPSVLVDATRLRQVVGNLVSNAIKFTERGEVCVRLRGRTSGAGLEVSLDVADTGPGIPLERIETMFEPYAQGDVTTYRRFGGTGLGLAICRRLVELMGGTIKVVSTVGAGACFSVLLELPLATTAVSSAPVESEEPLGLCVLLAEDNEINVMVATAMLKSLGCDVETVYDGREAILAARQRRFDAILMDVQMPGCDGLEATRAIREAEDDRHTPVIALTASATEASRQECLVSGMDDFLTKPLTRNKLREALRRAADTP